MNVERKVFVDLIADTKAMMIYLCVSKKDTNSKVWPYLSPGNYLISLVL